MSPTDRALLLPHFQPVALPLLTDLERPNRGIRTVYFMEAGIASVVAVQPDATKIEVGLIGSEGMSGIAVILGGDQSPIRPTFRSPAKDNGLQPTNCAQR